MTFYNDEDRKLYEDGVKMVAKMHGDYVDMAAEDEDAYISDAMYGYDNFPWDKAAILRATGLLDAAYMAVLDEVEGAVRDNLIAR